MSEMPTETDVMLIKPAADGSTGAIFYPCVGVDVWSPFADELCITLVTNSLLPAGTAPVVNDELELELGTFVVLEVRTDGTGFACRCASTPELSLTRSPTKRM